MSITQLFGDLMSKIDEDTQYSDISHEMTTIEHFCQSNNHLLLLFKHLTCELYRSKGIVWDVQPEMCHLMATIVKIDVANHSE